MKKSLILVFGVWLLWCSSCKDEDFPVPPASTVAKFSYTIDNNEFAPATVTFVNESIVPQRAGNVTYYWNFGDGSSAEQPQGTHFYEEPGVYNVRLVAVTASSFEVSEAMIPVVIRDPNATGMPVFFSTGNKVQTALINSQSPVFNTLSQVNGLLDVYGILVDTARSQLYISDNDGNKIYRCDTDGNNLTVFRSGLLEPVGMAIDYQENKLYWSTVHGIQRTALDEAAQDNFEDFVIGQGNDPEGVSIDPVNRKIYWINYNGGLWSKNLDGTGETQIFPDDVDGGSVIVINDKIYFDDYNASGDIYLRYANLDGTDVKIYTTGISRLVYGMAYDPEEDYLYWGDRNKNVIMRGHLNGDPAIETWYTVTGVEPRGIALGKMEE